MFFRKIKREHELVRAFQKLFLGQGGRLKPEAAVVLEFLRDEAGARGELGNGGTRNCSATARTLSANWKSDSNGGNGALVLGEAAPLRVWAQCGEDFFSKPGQKVLTLCHKGSSILSY